MKATCIVLWVFCATAAFGQAGASTLSNEPQMLQVPSHPQRASHQPMAPEQDLLIGSGSVHAKGERPLWELAPVSHAMPLGDVARNFKKEHATVKKSQIVWEN